MPEHAKLQSQSESASTRCRNAAAKLHRHQFSQRHPILSPSRAPHEELGKTMGGFANLRKGMLEGDMENGYVSVGHAISFIHEIKSAAQIIADMTRAWGNPA